MKKIETVKSIDEWRENIDNTNAKILWWANNQENNLKRHLIFMLVPLALFIFFFMIGLVGLSIPFGIIFLIQLGSMIYKTIRGDYL